MSSKQPTNGKRYVVAVRLADDWDHRAALVSVRIGDVVIRGISVWRSPRSGKLRVYFPSYQWGSRCYEEAIELPVDLRSEIEAEAIAEYKAAKAKIPAGAERSQ